jgi:pyruvate dehydrogenase E2 component (dihydrolipoamide acetyltransferase)
MAIELILPALGETMDEGTIARWVVADGAQVAKGQVLAEIESNKAVFELEATASGTLHISAAAGQTIPILTVIGHILKAGESLPGASAPSSGAVGTEHVPAGERQQTQPAASGVSLVPASSGRQFVSPRARRFAQEEAIDLRVVEGSGPQGRVEERDVRAYLDTRPRLSPLARKLAQEAGVSVTAAEPRDRITRADVEALLAQPAEPIGSAQTAPRVAAAAAVSTVTPAAVHADERVGTTPLGIIRQVIARRMAESASTTAAVTLTTETDATELVRLRDSLKEHVRERVGEPLSYNVLLAKLVSVALAEHPSLTSRLVGDTIHTPEVINIGIAVETEQGLVVPVIHDVAHKSLLTLSKEMADLREKAKFGALRPDDMSGGSFTITNLGQYGIDAFTPIINLPECAILGIGRIAPRAAVWGGQIAIRQIVVLSLTFDHRLVDGAPAARFLQRVTQMVENPHVLLLA